AWGSQVPAPCAMASASRWHSYLSASLSREGPRLQRFQQAEDVVLTLLERVRRSDPRFLVDYCHDLEALEFALRDDDDAITLEVPLRVDSNTLQNAVPWHCPLTAAWGGMEQTGGTVCLVPGKVLQHLKELLVSAIVHCQRHFLLQPGDLSAEELKEDAMELTLLVRGGWKTLRFNLVPVVRRQQEPIELCGQRSTRGFPQGPGSLRKATQEAHLVPASPYCWRSSTHLPILKLLRAVGTLKSARLDSLRLLEQVHREEWRQEAQQAGLTFDHLKVVFLWSTELFPSPEDWQDLEGSVYRLLVVLLCCLASARLPHFLRPEENLLHGDAPQLSSLYGKVESFARDPHRFLHFHFGPPVRTDGLHANPGLRALLQLPAKNETYWDTAYFDLLLSQVAGGHQGLVWLLWPTRSGASKLCGWALLGVLSLASPGCPALGHR
uniref:Mab-21 like 4 n=1 Tax=Nothoprocta perdicaria TaxID=30464 RepID=A0A8C6YPE1_NOTPE